MQAVVDAFTHRPIAGIGLVVATAWIVIIAVQCFTMAPWDYGGWYAHLIEAADLAWRGVVGDVAFIWLVEQAFA